MKRFVLGIVVICWITIVFAAGNGSKLTGILSGKTNKAPVEFATIALYEATTKKLVTGAMTDSTGCFHLEDVPTGRYYLVGSYVGYGETQSEMFIVGNGNQTVDVGVLWIDDKGQVLNEVVVAGRKSTFVPKLDRKVFNVGQDLMSSVGSASELMQNIPSVEVDLEGTVSLRGNENVTILINGKPSALMSGRTRTDALNQLAANSIERIEVITNPSAEYKPDGVSGIINIVLKKEGKAGLNGTLTANTGSHDRYNAGVNLNYGINGVNFFGGYAFRQDRYDRSIFDNRTSPTEYINQTTLGTGRPVSHTLRLGMGANLSTHDVMEISGSYNRRHFLRSERIESVTEDINHHLEDFYFRNRRADARENMWEGNFLYTHTYGKGNEWSVNYTYSSESEDEQNEYSTMQMENDTKDNEWVWDANYLHIGKVHWQHHLSERTKFSAGYELEALRAEQNYHVENWDGASFIPDLDRTSDFTHHRTLHSFFATLEMNPGEWRLMAGLRGEYADIRNNLYSLDSITRQHYTNIYPTLHASLKLNEHNELQLSYSLRVNRPEGSDMNPFAERINPLSLSAGNPDLKPEKIHSVEAGWLWHNDTNASLMTTVYYRYLTNQITEVSRYIDGGVLLTTKENLDQSHNAGLELIWSYSINHWLSFNWNANGYFNQINAEKLGFSRHRNTFSWSTLLNANFMPFKHYMMQFNARYRSATLVPQGRRDADYCINLGMKYDIPSINLSVLASVTDLFDTYRKSYTLDTPELKQKVEKRRNPRIFYIGVSYTFGGNKSKKHTAKLEYDESM